MSEEKEDWLKELSNRHYRIIGKAIHAWAQLEMQVYDYLRDEIPDKVYKALFNRHRPFSELCDILLLVFSIRYAYKGDVLLSDAEEMLKKTKNLTRNRNKLAHNPVMFWLDKIEEEVVVVDKIVEGKSGKNTKLDLEEIEKFAEEVDEVKFKLMETIMELTRPGV